MQLGTMICSELRLEGYFTDFRMSLLKPVIELIKHKTYDGILKT